MLEFCVVTRPSTEGPNWGTPRPHHAECHRRNVSMRVEGDELVGSFLFDDPELTLVCRVDLLAQKPATSVAAHLAGLYRQYGDAFINRLRGTFAIVLYDHNQRTLKAWVDQFGAERLVFTESDGSLVISTNIGLVLNAQRRQPSLSPEAIREYLLYTCIPTPKTVYEGVWKLAPGHQLISGAATKTQPYWDMSYDERPEGAQAESVWVDETRETVRSAVALSLGGSSRLGCFLSGGTDSSSVAGFVGRLTGQPPRTFSIGFDDPRYNEIRYARIAAKHFAADHHEYFVKPADIPAVAQAAAETYDEPFGNSSIVPTYYCARLASQSGVTHLLAGDGGDELFGGNSRYATDRLFQRYHQLPRWMRKSILEPGVSQAVSYSGLRLLRTAASYIRRSNLPTPDRYLSYSWVYTLPGQDVFTSEFLGAVESHDPMATARNHFYSAPAQNDLNRWLYLDLKITIADNDLRKVMTMSRLGGVTPRFPLLDPALAEFTGRIPSNMKVRGSRLRYLFKKAMADVLPNDIITKSKHGFGLPFSVWLGDSKLLRDFTFDMLGSTRCTQRGYFRRGLLDWLWSQYETVHRGYYGEILWVILMLELWHVKHVDARSDQVHAAVAGNLN